MQFTNLLTVLIVELLTQLMTAIVIYHLTRIAEPQ